MSVIYAKTENGTKGFRSATAISEVSFMAGNLLK